MKTKSLILLLSLVGIIFSSCEDKDAIYNNLADWKELNDAYLTNMKDSTSYTLYAVPGTTLNYYYKIVAAGSSTSTSPVATDSVKVHYRGMLVNGTVFDSTYSGAIPESPDSANASIVSNYISGWIYNLKQMKVNERRIIVLPYQIGYGTVGSGKIPPFSTLIFDMKLMWVKKN